MKVTCPECNYSSEIPEDKIPANAQLATCPKCGIKFKFRDIEQPAEAPEMEQEQQAAYDQQQYSEPAPHSENMERPESEPFDDAPYNEPQQPAYRQAEAQEEKPEEKQDIWQRLDSMTPEEEEEPKEEEDRDYWRRANKRVSDIPFENMQEYGFFPALFLTIKKVFLSPARFFSNMPLDPLKFPILFSILMMSFQIVSGALWEVVNPSQEMQGQIAQLLDGRTMGAFLGEMWPAATIILLFIPVFALMGLYLMAGLTHVMLMIFGAANNGFRATFRAMAYSHSGLILCVLPIIGQPLGAIAALVLSFIAYKNIHKTSYLRVVLSIVMPYVLLLVIAGLSTAFNQPTI